MYRCLFLCMFLLRMARLDAWTSSRPKVPPRPSTSRTSTNLPQQDTTLATREGFDRNAWNKGFHTVTSEDCHILDLPADFPTDIRGTFYQNGHAKFKVGDELIMHPFDADGMVSALTFQGKEACFRNRFVQTPGYREEAQKRKVCYRGMFGTAKNKGAWYSNIFDLRLKNLANTHVLYQDSRLWALWEGGKPFELDPVTLETLSSDAVDLDGSLDKNDNYAAHYKIDPDTGNVVNFSVSVVGTSSIDPNDAHLFTLYEHDTSMKLVSKRTFELPGFGLAHDVAMSKNYVCAFQAPSKFNALPFLLGQKGVGNCILPDNDAKHATLYLLPRYGPLEPITIDLPMCFSFHLANAFEDDGGAIVIDAVMTDKLLLADTESTRYPERPLWETFDMSAVAYQLRRYRIDVANRQLVSVAHMTDDVSANVEFPVINPNFVSKAYRWAYIPSGASATAAQPIQGLSKIDVEQGKTVAKWLSPSDAEFIGEPVFVARSNAASDEDDGYLMAYAMNGQAKETTLYVFDCKDISAGPISQVAMPIFLSFALHGVFVPEATPDFDVVKASFSS